jgi:hypothetical protein
LEVEHKFVDILLTLLLTLMLLVLCQSVLDHVEVLTLELLRPVRDFLHTRAPVIQFGFGSWVSLFIRLVRVFLVEKVLDSFDPLLEFSLEERNFLVVRHVFEFSKVLWVDLEVLLFGSHKIDSLLDLFLEFISKVEEFFPRVCIRYSPIGIFIRAKHWIIDHLHQMIEDLDRIRCDLSVHDFLVRKLSKIDLLFAFRQTS